MQDIHLLDLKFQEAAEAIASFLVETPEDGLLLIESGPESTHAQLEAAIREKGFDPADVRHVLLTHIHFDHAGAAWKWAARGAKVYVHPVGLPHLASPEKLWNSAAQIYGDDMERLWGSMEPIAEEYLYAVSHEEVLQIGGLTIKALHTPGHAVHHVAYKLGDSIFTGDVAGVKIQAGPVVPPCPPPDIHIPDWKASIALLRQERPARLLLTHYGEIQEVDAHLQALEAILDDWAGWIKPHFDAGTNPAEITPAFMAYTEGQLREKGCSDALIQVYQYANPSWMSVAGLLRFWKLKASGRIL
ncbi:beta-lactamase [Nitritalea halalkaliphila LW7]|uniref:Beta-lactamase n=1 Tax=Nitritalea halalkaliphila LW7 TaxID=1189621 RepID=I5BZV5_9BACT|nr:MBL fold metallo-hydrolase [Nitritalea halalkaliphila]EIM75107.1 beta-lactamase [Nitritalea halalkaliphila LW7]